MSAQKDYYKILGISEGVSLDEIKRAYRTLAKKHHPDANPQDKKNSEEKFKEVSEAYYVVGDPKRRADYDAFRRSGFSQQSRQGGSSARYQGAQGFDFDEILRMFRQGQSSQSAGSSSASQGRANGWSGAFEDIFGGGGPFASGSRDSEAEYPADGGSDVQAVLKLSRHRAQKGGEVTFHTDDGRKITVKIPAGVVSGKKLRLARQGSSCPACRHPGDLILTLKVE